jgi:hypothetical protein
VVLYINASRTEVGSEYVVTGPPALIEEMAGRAGYRTDAFVQQILGAIEVNGEALRFHEGSHDVPGQGKPATLHLLSGWAQAHGFFAVSLASPPKTRHLRFANKQVVVRTQSVRASGPQNLETQSTSEKAVVYQPGDPRRAAAIYIQSTAPIGNEDEPVARLMERSGLLSLPVAGELVVTLLWAVPFLLLLTVNRRVAVPDARLYHSAIVLVLGLQLGLAFLASVLVEPSVAAQASPWLAGFVGRAAGIGGRIYPVYTNANTLLITLLAGWLWPVLVARAANSGMKDLGLPAPRGGPAIALATLLTLAATVSWGLWLAWVPAPSAFICALCLLALAALLLFWALWEVFPVGRAIAAAVAGAAAIAVLGFATSLPNFTNATPPYRLLLRIVGAGIVVLFGARLAAGFLRVSGPLLPAAVSGRLLRGRWLWLAALVICLPTAWLADASQIWWGQVEALAFVLRDLFVFAVIVFLLKALKDASERERWPLLPPLAIGCGIVLALVSFYSSTSIWFYFPVPLVLGFVLLNWGLLVPPSQAHSAQDLAARWPALARTALTLRRLERTGAAVRKGLEDKLAKGEIAWSEYQEKLGPVTGAAEAERRNLVIDGSSVEPVLFSFGPAHLAWINGRSGAIYSVFFALPWILLSVRDLLNAPAGQSYILLSFLASALMIAARWTLYGFFFGYFYAYIRGRNGFQKALAFWFALVLPSVLASLLSSSLSRASLAPLLFWTLQVFLHCVLLGLFAGELESLWRAGLSWRQLLEFHNLTALSAWGSSVLIALGAAVTTALSTGLGSLITEGLKYAGVLPQAASPGR